MAEDKDKFIGGLGSGDSSDEGSIFSEFRAPKKRPAAPPPPAAPAPAPAKPPPAPQPVEAAPKPLPVAPPPPAAPQPVPLQAISGGDTEMLNYLKKKVGELEGNLKESQEKGLGFAYELKARDEARKESRREMEEFLAVIKQQQAAAETERVRMGELERARARIEALEQKLSDLSAKQAEPQKPQAMQREELERMSAELKAGLGELFAAKAAALKTDLGEMFSAKSAELAVSVNAQVAGAVGGRLEDERAARARELEALAAGFAAAIEKDAAEREAHKEELRRLAGSVSRRADMLETAFASSITAMKKSMEDLSAELKQSGERAILDSAASRSAASDAVSRMSAMEVSFRSEIAALSAACSGLNAGLDVLKETVAGAAPDTATIAKEILAFLQDKGRAEAGTAASGAHDYGYISASLSNLEKVFFSAADMLRRAEAELRDSVGLSSSSAGAVTLRQAKILRDAEHEMTAAMQVFRGMKAEALKPIKDRLAP